MSQQSPLKKAFTDGMFLLLPFGITIGLIYWAWSFLRKFIPNLSVLLPEAISTHPNIHQIQDFLSLIIILCCILIFGILGSTFLGKFLTFLIDKLLMAPTFIRPIYTTFKKLTESIFSQEGKDPLSNGISESIMVPYPNKNTKSIAFVTSPHARHLMGAEEGNKWLTVYLPSAPIVSAGFFLLCKKEDTTPCILPSVQAMTTIISVGSVQNFTANNKIKNINVQKPNILRVWFLNGFLFLIPLTATVAILSWAFNYIYQFAGQISTRLPNLFPNIPTNYYELLINSIIVLILILVIIIIGFIGESAFGVWMKSLSNKLLNSIPMFNKVYSIVEQITKVFSPDPSHSKTFDKAVLVPFPSTSTYTIGFLTGDDSSYIQDNDNKHLVPVFIATTPIPTTGWFITVPKEELIILDMPIEKAFGLVISGGILTEDK